MKHHKSSKLVAKLTKELSELGDKLEKKTNEDEVLQQKLSETTMKLSLLQLYTHKLGGIKFSENVRNQLGLLHEVRIAEKRVEYTIEEI